MVAHIQCSVHRLYSRKKADPVKVMIACIEGFLDVETFIVNQSCAVVVIASGGYPYTIRWFLETSGGRITALSAIATLCDFI